MDIGEQQTNLLATNMRKLVHSCFVCVYGFDEPDNLQKHLADHAMGVKGQLEEEPNATTVSDTSESGSDLDEIPRNKSPSALDEKAKANSSVNVLIQEANLAIQNKKPIAFDQILQTLVHRKSTNYVCTKCNVNFLNSREQYERHMARNHALLEYEYRNCPHEFAEHYELRIHMHIDNIEKLSKCPYCKQPTKTLSKHMKNHCKGYATEGASYYCKLCPDMFEKESFLQCHIFKKHYGCPLCGEYFKNGVQLRDHLAQTHNLSPFTCEDCEGSAFKSKKELKVHRARIHNWGTVHQCKTCDEIFFGPVALVEHKKRVHDKQEREKHKMERISKPEISSFKCPICQEGFVESEEFRHHVKAHGSLTEYNVYECQLCPAWFSKGLRPLTSHLEKDHPEMLSVLDGKYPCPICDNKFHGEKLLGFHIYLSHYQCAECSKYCKTPFELKAHQGKAHGLSTFQCQKCQSAFKTCQNLKDHRKSKHEERIYKCSTCDKVLLSEQSLNRHTKTVHTLQHTCNLCGEGFRLKSKLKSHERSVHGVKGDYKCSKCDRYFVSSYKLKIHEQVHIRLQCGLCKVSFSLKSSLRSHLQASHGEKSSESAHGKNTQEFRCSLCDRLFRKKYCLRQHVNFCHLGIKQKAWPGNLTIVQCHICGNKFTKSHLTRHMQSMHYGKSFKCEICNKSFKWKGIYDQHVRSHTEGPYPCHVCGKLSKTRAGLEYHMRRHNELLPKHRYSCDHCDKKFFKASAWQRHQLTHNPDQDAVKMPKRRCNTVCKICNKDCDTNYERIVHQVAHAQLRPYLCQNCGCRWAYKNGLNSHLRNQKCRPSKRELWSCAICLKWFRKESEMTTHASVHKGHSPFECSQCDLGNETFIGLLDHIGDHIAKSEWKEAHMSPKFKFPDPLQCRICFKLFPTVEACNQHIETHDKSHQYFCTECNTGFEGRQVFYDHLANEHGNQARYDRFKNASTSREKSKANTEDLFICEICRKGFRTKYGLTIHMGDHTGKFGQKCMMCNSTFKYKFQLSKHMKNHHNVQEANETKYDCEICGKTFCKKINLQKHMQEHTGVMLYKCTKCNCGFKYKYKLNSHVKKVHDNQPMKRPKIVKKTEFPCEYCDKVFRGTTGLRAHESEHTGKLWEKCKMCDSTFKYKYQLDRHMAEEHHVKRKSFQCHYCGQEFLTKVNFQSHLTTHTKELDFKCKECGKSFGMKHQLRSHMLRHRDKTFKCDVCGKGFVQESELKVHAIRHDEKAFKFPCSWCSKKFCVEYELKLHLAAKHDIIDGDMKKTWCDICQKWFPNKIYNKHLVKHSKEKPYVCDVCGKGFSYKCTLKLHMPEHTGEFDHKCTMCTGTFKYKYQLEKHMENEHESKQATKDLLRTCELCDSAFKTKSLLDNHMVDEHGEEPLVDHPKKPQKKKTFRCDICYESFKTKSQYENHMDDEHNDDD